MRSGGGGGGPCLVHSGLFTFPPSPPAGCVFASLHSTPLPPRGPAGRGRGRGLSWSSGPGPRACGGRGPADQTPEAGPDRTTSHHTGPDPTGPAPNAASRRRLNFAFHPLSTGREAASFPAGGGDSSPPTPLTVTPAHHVLEV